MWLFNRKKRNPETQSVPVCPFCWSNRTRLITCHGTSQPDYVKTWRGHRYWTCRCYNCGKDFYIDEAHGGATIETLAGDETIDDEEELRAAEDEIKRQIEEDNDRRCW